jgi:hypothetical protein
MSSVDNVSGLGPINEAQESDGTETSRPSGSSGQTSTFGDLNKLKELLGPEGYNKFLQLMATGIINEWKKHPEKLKKIRRDHEKK